MPRVDTLTPDCRKRPPDDEAATAAKIEAWACTSKPPAEFQETASSPATRWPRSRRPARVAAETCAATARTPALRFGDEAERLHRRPRRGRRRRGASPPSDQGFERRNSPGGLQVERDTQAEVRQGSGHRIKVGRRARRRPPRRRSDEAASSADGGGPPGVVAGRRCSQPRTAPVLGAASSAGGGLRPNFCGR